jgi:hypothetical protein
VRQAERERAERAAATQRAAEAMEAAAAAAAAAEAEAADAAARRAALAESFLLVRFLTCASLTSTWSNRATPGRAGAGADAPVLTAAPRRSRQVTVVAARNLPRMDLSTGQADPYCKARAPPARTCRPGLTSFDRF